MQIHHIVPEAEGGSGEYDNGIPVCLDCHAEIESKSNMGRRFTAGELLEHRNRWFAVVRDRPEVLVRAARSQTETGPLEALLSELEFNRLAVFEGTLDENFPPLGTEQFHRAIATNALAALEPGMREGLNRTYGLMIRINYHFDEMARMDRSGGAGGAWAHAKAERTKLRGHLRELIPRMIDSLERALGRGDAAAGV